MSITRLSPLFAVLALFALAACAKGPKVVKTDPFLISKKEFKSTVKIIALVPVTLPDGLPDPQPIVDTFDKLIEERLRREGYSVVHPHEYTKVWQEQIGEQDNVVDPDTGARDLALLSSAMFRTMEAMQADFKVDAAMIASVEVVEAPFAGGRAVWDGTKQSIQSGGPMTDFFAGSPEGKVGALSLMINVLDIDGNTVYTYAGGIEVLSKLVGKEFVLVSRQDLFSDAERVEKSVKIALDPLSK